MFKNLSQFKRDVKVGQKVKVINKLFGKESDRIVTKKQTNAIITGETMEDEIFMWYPKARYMNFKDNIVEFIAYRDERDVMIPSVDFEEGEVWLTMEFEK